MCVEGVFFWGPQQRQSAQRGPCPVVRPEIAYSGRSGYQGSDDQMTCVRLGAPNFSGRECGTLEHSIT